MSEPAGRPLRRRIADGDALRGVLLRMPAEPLVELAALSGLDFVVVDCEHGPGDQAALYHHLLAAAAHGMPALVRVAALPEVGRVLDLGADGIVVPHVDSPAAAADAVAMTRYPPDGRRGFATYTRAGRFGRVTAAQHRQQAESTVVVVMIEDPDGVAAASGIAAVDGVDAVFVGPADLAASSASGTDIPRVVAQVRAASAPTPDMVIVGSVAEARLQEAAGAGIVLFNAQHVITAAFAELAGR